MNEKKAIQAVCVPLAVLLVSAPFLEAVTFDNPPHVEPTQHEEALEPTLNTSPYTSTTGAVVHYRSSGLEFILVPGLHLKK